MKTEDALKNLIDMYGGSSGSSSTINKSEFNNLLKGFDANQDGEFSKREFSDLADAWGIDSKDASKIYDNLTDGGKKDLTSEDIKGLAKDELSDGSLGLNDLNDLRSRLLGIGGAKDTSLPGGAGNEANAGLNTKGIDLGKAVDGFNKLDKDDSNTLSSKEMKNGLKMADKDGNGKLSESEFTKFAEETLGLSEKDAEAAYKVAKKDAGGEQPSISGALDIFGGDGGEQGLGDFLESISDLRKDARRI
jgi:EF hand